MSFKKWLLALGGFLGIAAGVLTVIPAAAPFAPIVKVAGSEIEKHAEKMRDQCPDQVCARDAQGRCHMCGPQALVDGGTCECN